MTLARCAYEDQDIFANAWTLPIVPSQEWDDAEEGLAVKAAEAFLHAFPPTVVAKAISWLEKLALQQLFYLG